MTASTPQLVELVARLTVPDSTVAALTFADNSQDGMERYIRRLPHTNPPEVLARLYRAVPEIAAVDAAPGRKIALLDASALPVLDIIRKTTARLPFSEHNRKTYSLCLALLRHMAAGYKSIVPQAQDNSTLQPQTLARALYGALLFQGQMLLLCWSAYLPIPTGLWREIHCLHQIARLLSLLSLPIKSECYGGESSDTVEDLYLAIATLGALDPYGKTPEDLRRLYGYLNRNAGHIQLAASHRDGLFCIDPDADRPPLYTRKLGATPARAMSLDPCNLIGLINTDISQALPPRLQKLILRHCTSEVLRGNQRESDNTSITVVTGMGHVHRLLTRSKSITDYVAALNGDDSPRQRRVTLDGPVLGEEFAVGEPRGHWMRETGHNPESAIDYRGAGSGKPQAGSKIQAFKAHRFDRSANGAGLHFDQGGDRLGPGELVAVRAANSEQWQLAISRWARTDRDAKRNVGVEYLSGKVMPCAVCLVKTDQDASPYFPAFILRDDDHATLLVPSIPFVRHSRVRVMYPGRQFITQLLTQTESTFHLSCFTFRQ